jgi:3'-phosphoadenosine 5'-phosphosulfate sulfotransferase (PAPS reductase)/FAD synthetase
MDETVFKRVIPIRQKTTRAPKAVPGQMAFDFLSPEAVSQAVFDAGPMVTQDPVGALGLADLTKEQPAPGSLAEALEKAETTAAEIDAIDPVVVEVVKPGDASPDFPQDLEGMVARAERTIMEILRRGRPVAVSCSYGKDSSTVLSLTLSAASKLAETGVKVPTIAVLTSDTGVENPEMVQYYKAEQEKVKAFAHEYDLDVIVATSRPNLSSGWSTRVIGGRGLPAFPGGNHDCSIDYKVRPLAKLRKQIFKQMYRAMGKDNRVEPVVLIGTRYDESEERKRKMIERGESDMEMRRGVDAKGKPTDLFLSPICFWNSDDVWMYLGEAGAGAHRSYSDFQETVRVYRDAMGECVIMGDDEAKAKKNSKACGARHGCAVCTAVGVDHSMENMISGDPKYHYMKGLNQLQRFIVNTRWDMSRRTWIGRTIVKNHIRIAPDIYSPKMLEDLLKYALTIDRDEKIAAGRAGLSAPRFELVPLETLVAIDANWSLQAYHRPFHAMYLYDQVYEKGKSFPVPDVDPVPRPVKMPTPKYFPVADWDDGRNATLNGLRDHILDMVRFDTDADGCMGLRELKDGRQMLALNNSESFSVDLESVHMLLTFEFDEMMKKHDSSWCNPLDAYKFYSLYGTISVAPGKMGEIDDMVRRGNFKVANGLWGELDVNQLLDRCVTAEEAGIKESGNGKKKKRGEAGSRSFVVEDFSGAEDAVDEDDFDDGDDPDMEILVESSQDYRPASKRAFGV